MAQRVEHFPVTVPPNTSTLAPVTTPLKFPDGEVVEFEFIVPPGPSGLVGWQILYGPQVIIPRNSANFFVMDNEHDSWPIDNYPTGGQWAVRAYNIDIYPHLLQFTFHLNEFSKSIAVVPPLIPIV
jgi:hypothetical protein